MINSTVKPKPWSAPNSIKQYAINITLPESPILQSRLTIKRRATKSADKAETENQSSKSSTENWSEHSKMHHHHHQSTRGWIKREENVRLVGIREWVRAVRNYYYYYLLSTVKFEGNWIEWNGASLRKKMSFRWWEWASLPSWKFVRNVQILIRAAPTLFTQHFHSGILFHCPRIQTSPAMVQGCLGKTLPFIESRSMYEAT